MKSVVVLKWVLFSVLTFFLVIGLAPDASAKQGDSSIDGFIGFGTGPKDPELAVNFGGGIGGGFGFGYEVVDDLQLRLDSSVFAWSKEIVPGLFENLRNTIIFLGGRYYFPVATNVKLFAELGLTVNVLEASQEFIVGPPVITTSETKIGGAPGVGVEFMVTPHWGLGTSLRYNLIGKGVGIATQIKPSFFSAAFLIAYHF